MQVPESPQCPLCESNQVKVEDSLVGEELLKLWRESGFLLAPEDLVPVVQTVQVNLWRCRSCRFCSNYPMDPIIAGQNRP
jgi:hypothetical protein